MASTAALARRMGHFITANYLVLGEDAGQLAAPCYEGNCLEGSTKPARPHEAQLGSNEDKKQGTKKLHTNRNPGFSRAERHVVKLPDTNSYNPEATSTKVMYLGLLTDISG